MDIPDSLRHRLDLFRETGPVFRVSNEQFAENPWIQVMLGQGIENGGAASGARPT
jgi:tryptophan halogenase